MSEQRENVPLWELIADARDIAGGGRPTLTDDEWDRIFSAAERSLTADKLFEARTSELLEANNRALERARAAERHEAEMTVALRAAAKVIGALITMDKPQT